jgi:hypothetical protein
VKGLEYNPAGRVAYNLSDRWAVAPEEYDGVGRLRALVPLDQQFHETWAGVDLKPLCNQAKMRKIMFVVSKGVHRRLEISNYGDVLSRKDSAGSMEH